MTKVLDASAVLALLRRERGFAQVTAALPQAVMSAVNAAEVMRVLVRAGASPIDARRAFARLHLSVIPVSEQDVATVAEMAKLTPDEIAVGRELTINFTWHLANLRSKT